MADSSSGQRIRGACPLVSPGDTATPCQHNVLVGLSHSGCIQAHLPSHTDEGLVLEYSFYRATCSVSGGQACRKFCGADSYKSALCEMRLGSEGNHGRGTMRRRRGRRLLLVRRLLLLLLSRLLCGLLCCCFLRCHENATPLRCQNVNQYMCGIAEFVQRVKFCFLDFSGRSERELRSCNPAPNCLSPH